MVMKKNLLIMVVMTLMVSTATAQNLDAANAELRRNLAQLFDNEAKALQPDSVTDNGEWQKVIETTMTAKDSYKYARSVLARMIPNYQQRVKLEDEKDSKIICDIALELSGMYRSGMDNILLDGVYQMTMTLVFKDNKYRVRSENVTCTYRERAYGATLGTERGEAFSTTNAKTDGWMINDMKSKAGEFMKNFSKALAAQKDDDNF